MRQKPVARTTDAYLEHRRSLVAASIPTVAVVVFGVTLVYASADVLSSPTRFGPWVLVYLLELATPLAAWYLARAPFRSQVEWVVLAADMAYAAGVAAHGLFPRTMTSSIALTLSLKMVATALFFPWGAGFQYLSTAVTIVLYLAVLGVSGRATASPELLGQLLVPLSAAVFSVVGAARIERVRHTLFEQGQSLAESQERYRIVSELVSDFAVACRIEPDGTVVREWITESAFSRMTGYGLDAFATGKGADGIIRLEDWPVVHPDDLPSTLAALQRLMAGESVESEYRLVTKGGEVRWVRSVGKPVWDETARRSVGFYAVVQDVTGRKQAEDARRQLEQQRADFLAMITHDLKQPVTILLGNVALLRELEGLPTEVAESLEPIERGSRQIAELLDNFLQTSQIEAGVMTLSRIPVALGEVLAGVRAGYERQARQHHIRLEIEGGSASLPPVWGDRIALERVFTNLLSNALKFTPDGGHITVRAVQDGRGVAVTVADTGAGIAAEEIPTLFARYGQTAHGRSRGGTGLGLFVVKSLVEAHGGSVRVESEIGKGATFVVRLPYGEDSGTG